MSTNNMVLLVGFVSQHLQVKRLENGGKKVTIRMATHDYIKNASGEEKNMTTWHDVIAWDQSAEYAQQTFVKGSRILVRGRIIYRTYEDLVGHKRYVTEIKAENLTNLDR